MRLAIVLAAGVIQEAIHPGLEFPETVARVLTLALIVLLIMDASDCLERWYR